MIETMLLLLAVADNRQPPVLRAVARSPTQIEWFFEIPGEPPDIGGRVRECKEADGDWHEASTATPALDSHLAPASPRTCRARLGGGRWIGPVTAATLPPPAAPPEAIVQLAAQPRSPYRIDLSWTTPREAERVVLQVMRPDGQFEDRAHPLPWTSSLADGGLLPGAARTYRIRAENRLGASPWSAPVRAATLPHRPLAGGQLSPCLERRERACETSAFAHRWQLGGLRLAMLYCDDSADFEMVARFHGCSRSLGTVDAPDPEFNPDPIWFPGDPWPALRVRRSLGSDRVQLLTYDFDGGRYREVDSSSSCGLEGESGLPEWDAECRFSREEWPR